MHPTKHLARRVRTGVAAVSLSLGGALGALVVVASPASADTIPVTNTLDDGATDSLRYVLEHANDGDVIVLTAGATYSLNCPEGGDVGITGSVTIEGNGATIQQTCADRVLYTKSPLTLRDVTITGGNVDGSGGGLFEDNNANVVLQGATFTGNTASDSGGGIATSGDLSITDSIFNANHDTGGDGGAVKVFSDTGTTTIDGSTFTDNTTDGWGGAFEQQLPNILPAPVAAATGYVLTVTGSTFTGNTANSDGGGALDTEDDNAAVTVDDSTFTDNSGGWGGGIGTFGDSTTLHASGSTFNGNSSFASGGAVQMAIGALEASAVAGQDAATFVNSTITGNSQGTDGAINIDGTVELNDVTMTANTNTGARIVEPTSSRGVRAAVSGADDAANIVSAGLTSFASVVTGASGGPNCESVDVGTDDLGYNFSDDSSCDFNASTSNVNTPNDPVLGGLADNGGPTETLLPLAGSPLLDAVPTTTCTGFGITVDQRGITRPQGTGCDIGAVEVEVQTASLDVTKVVTGTNGNPVPSAGYTFEVSCSDGTTGTLTVADATAGGTSGTLDGIEAGAACRVTEAAVVYTKTNVTGQPTVTYAPAAASSTAGVVVSDGVNTVTVTNNYGGINLLGLAVVTPAVAVEPRFTG